jgi:hypothetical protein
VPISIDFRELQLLIVGIFAFVGLMRGWYREGITSLFVAVLGILVWEPETGQGLIDFINRWLRVVLGLFRSGFDPSRFSTQTVDSGPVLDFSSYRLWMIFTAVMVIVSYMIGEASFKRDLTPLGRLLGGILGAANGYVLLALARQYLTNYWASQVAQGQGVTATGPSTVTVTNVPAGNLAGGYGIIFILGILIAVIALLILGDRLRGPIL